MGRSEGLWGGTWGKMGAGGVGCGVKWGLWGGIPRGEGVGSDQGGSSLSW